MMGIGIALTPRVRMMVICDGIRESKIEPGVFHLKGVRQSTTAAVFPFVPLRLRLFLLLSSPRAGIFPGYIRVVNNRTDRVVFHSNLDPRPEFGVNGDVLPYCTPVRCIFPEHGEYIVQIWFFQEHGIDVLKGEMPFFVALEESQT